MCNHHLLIELRPEEGDYRDWETVDRVDLGGGLGVPAGQALKGPHERALELAGDYAIAYPERARDIIIQQYSCNGPEDEGVRPFPNGTQREMPGDVARVAAENVKLREALRFYADRYRWQLKTRKADPHGQLTVSVDAARDAGERARRALRGLDPDPPDASLSPVLRTKGGRP